MQVADDLWVSPAKAAAMLDKGLDTIWAYEKAGLIVAIAPNGRGPGKRVYFDADEIREFAKKGAAGAAEYRRKRDAQ